MISARPEYKRRPQAEGHMYPLWQPWDFRRRKLNPILEDGDLHTAYHFHDFFEFFDVLKNKYTTYAHGDGQTEKPLSKMGKVQWAIESIKEQYKDPIGLDNMKGRKPLLLDDELYRIARIQDMMVEIEAEEKKEQQQKGQQTVQIKSKQAKIAITTTTTTTSR